MDQTGRPHLTAWIVSLPPGRRPVAADAQVHCAACCCCSLDGPHFNPRLPQAPGTISRSARLWPLFSESAAAASLPRFLRFQVRPSPFYPIASPSSAPSPSSPSFSHPSTPRPSHPPFRRPWNRLVHLPSSTFSLCRIGPSTFSTSGAAPDFDFHLPAHRPVSGSARSLSCHRVSLEDAIIYSRHD